MPFVPVTERCQAMTTGINGQLEIARTSTGPMKEYDIKNVKRTRNFNNQDKTGSFAQGYANSEVGHISHTITASLINHVDDPVGFDDPCNVYYCIITIDGFGTFKGYMRIDSWDDGVTVTGDHDVNFSARACIGFEGTPSAAVLPSWTPYDPSSSLMGGTRDDEIRKRQAG